MNLTDYILRSIAPQIASESMILPRSVTFYGDSIMHSVFPHIKMEGVMLQNFSQPGDTARNAWRRFPYDSRSTQVIVLEHGTNDLSIGDDPIPYLRGMATRAIDEGRLVVFTGIAQRADPTFTIDSRIQDLAEDLMCQFVGWQDFSIERLELVDGLHPGEAGQKQLAKDLVRVLTPLLT